MARTSKTQSLFHKPVAELDEMETRYFQMELQTAMNSILGRYSGRGGQFLMALSVALRNEAGKSLYAKNQPKTAADDDNAGNFGR